jgi:flagellar biosynthesis GTPase FlhF
MFSLIPSIPEGAKSVKATTIVAAVLSFVAAVAIAPFVLLAIGGIAGLITALAVGYTSMKLAPWFGMKISNLGMTLLRMEATQNPIPTLLNEQLQREDDLARENRAAEELNNAVNQYAAKQAQMARDFPEDAKMFEEHLESMRQLLRDQYSALKESEQGLKKFKAEVRRADAIWKMTQVANSVSATAGRLTQSDAIRKIQTETALDSVRASMATSFAKLDHLARIREGKITPPASAPALSSTSKVEVLEQVTAEGSGKVPVFVPSGVTRNTTLMQKW